MKYPLWTVSAEWYPVREPVDAPAKADHAWPIPEELAMRRLRAMLTPETLEWERENADALGLPYRNSGD